MKFLTLLFVAISFQCLGQDTLYIDDDIFSEKGKFNTIKYQSGVTNMKMKTKIKTGPWSYFDQEGILLKTEEYVTSGRSSFIKGQQVFYNAEGRSVLIRTYEHNTLVKEEALEPCVIILKNETIELVARGNAIIVYYEEPPDLRWFNYSNILRINLIENPYDSFKLAIYKDFEDSIGNTDLLRNGSFSIRHPKNVVANPSFEDHPTIEKGLTSFNDEITSWIPASVSPDFFITPNVARTGIAFTGFRVYSPYKDIEYIQNRLNHRLAKNQKYCFSAYIKLGPSSTATDAFGVYFSSKAIQFKKLSDANLTPHLSLDKEYMTYKSRWMLLQCSYVASGTENWMTIGSFKPTKEVNLLNMPGQGKESYYYIDDISLVPITDDAECPCNIKGDSPPIYLDHKEPSFPSDGKQDFGLEFEKMEVGERLVLEDVYFDIDKYDILDKSEATLLRLVAILEKHPTIRLEVSGHTSTTGGYDHNVVLSGNRAVSVKGFLVENGIASSRLTTEGYGPDQPIAPNDTEVNRQMNRRVELKILAK